MQTTLKIKLLAHTPDADKLVAAAAKLCYSAADVDTLMDDLTADKVEAMCKKLTDLGHESPIEHASYTFAVEGVSRALLAQLTRHRIASYSVQSQRYVDKAEFEYIIPPSIEADPELKAAFIDCMERIDTCYSYFRSANIPTEDARFVLPNACDTRIIFTMNARSLHNFFKLRCCNRAQWEIRAMADEMLRLCREVSPVLFRHAGASCAVTGKCSEGDMCCGEPRMESEDDNGKIDCSDTVNFIRESDRMCESFGSTCDGCPLLRKDMVCDTYMSKYPDRAVEIVQKWSDEHPVKTRLEDLLKKFPDFKLLSEIGRPTFKPRIFGYCDCCALCPNNKAEHCWNEPVDGGATGKAVE